MEPVATDYLEMATYALDQTEYAIGLEQQQDPGTFWEYNNAAVQSLERVMEVATGMTLDAYADQYLFGPLGMASSFARDDAGNPIVYADMTASCTDLMRFGYMVLRGGRWADGIVISESWMDEATSTSSALNDAYGYLWWLNRDGHYVEPTGVTGERVERDGKVIPDASENIVMANGFQDQLVVIDPDHDLVITRIGGEGDPIHALVSGEPLNDPVFVNDLVFTIIDAIAD